jgi:N-acetylglucosaminyldiphosphoundecaprenol N-acetyl-beta-D-mannosaminyltransferase
MLVASRKDRQFRDTLNKAELSLCDGVGISLAARILGKSLPERITGVDLMEKLWKEMVRKPDSIGFLGGRDRVALKTAECLEKKYGKLTVAFTGEEWDEKQMANGKWQMVDILFVAFGAPKQEHWMAENVEKGVFRVAIGVGGAFDYFGGTAARAPKLLRTIGLEWLYRLVREPWRWRRQLALGKFIWLVVNERFKPVAE